jgi:BirA family transcriptional regulator, biotin operon repressor / biotin---[acetyl-CoA-carboxylase] ligase
VSSETRLSGEHHSHSANLGHPRLHLRRCNSTNERARQLAIEGAPHGTVVSAAEQTAGRGRQGRSWIAPPGSALLCSLVLRWSISDRPPPLLSLIAGIAVCDVVGTRARMKWPNDVVLEMPHYAVPYEEEPHERAPHEGAPYEGGVQHEGHYQPELAKLAGILVEGRPQDGWAVLGIGVNVAVRLEQLPGPLRGRAASLQLPTSAIEPTMVRLLQSLERRLVEPTEKLLDAWRARDALYGQEISWRTQRPQQQGGRGRAEGIDDAGRLLVHLENGATVALSAGEVHLGASVE